MEPPRRSGSSICDLHPHDEAFAGGTFCPSCLRDRLAGLDASPSPSSSSLPRRSTSSLRLRSLFSHHRPSIPDPLPNPNAHPIPDPLPSSSALSSSSHLRRCKSFSASTATQGARPRARDRGTPIHQDLKPMKIHLDLHSANSHSHSNFFVRKWHQWRGKHGPRHSNQHQHQHQHYPTEPPLIPHPPAFSAFAGARRSCDSDPRFSLDHCPPRFSFDQPRPSWDAYSSASARPPLAFSRFHPLLSAPDCPPDPAVICRYDDQIPVEEQDDNESAIPGSQAQTRDYYLDSSSSSRRRRSFERSASMRKTPPLEIESDHRSLPAFNSKVSPAGGAEFYHSHHAVAVATRTTDGMSGSFSSVFRDPCNAQVADKKPKKWSKGWNLWGLIQRKGNGKDHSANSNVPNNHPDNFLRCNSSVSARSSFSNYNAAGSMRRNSVDMININNHTDTNNGYTKKRRDEFVLERNRSARFSPSQVDNGMLRFYLTPMRGNQSGRRNSGVRPVSTGSQSVSASSVHRLY